MKSKTSVGLQAAEAIGAMVKQGTRSTGKAISKKKLTSSKNVSKKAAQAARPTQTKPESKTTKPNKPPKPPTPPTPPKSNKSSKSKKEESKNSYFKQKFDTPPVDLSFDRDPGYTVKDKRIK